MFGFLTSAQPPAEWRRGYAHVCQVQRQLFGISSLPFLSFEAVFLYQLQIDLGINQPLPSASPKCCRLRTTLRHGDLNREAAEFSAALGMTLAGVKLQDDIQDHNRWLGHLLWWKFKKAVRSANRLLNSRSADLQQRIDLCLQAHAELESRSSAVTFEETMNPTGEAFGAVFRASAESSGVLNSSASVDTLAQKVTTCEKIGRHVGRSIIAWDCAVDFENDRLQKQFTPLKSSDDVMIAFDQCRLELVQAGWMCPAGSASRQILAGVIARVLRRQSAPPRVCSPTILERWGLVRQRGFSYAHFDCCAVVECTECCASGAEAGACLKICDPACCECFVCCFPEHACGRSCSPAKKNKSAHTEFTSSELVTPQTFGQFIGRTGVTHGALTPVGYIRIDNNRIPARSSTGDLIGPDLEVRVVSADEFSVTVKS